ncbi:protein POLAR LOCALIZATION DURING ASYMMETRIC DIVISION AND REDISTRIBUTION [Nicotiana tabacum]|uniref:Protein POLAR LOCALIZATION DURING ASYMMETRIC DIVISION AND REDISTRIBUTION n=2 Tax=Nicotiana TaxID=4085 RepID=A0A1S4B4Y6_TOBAC|nr:PREDICTED: protein POLAR LOCALIZATION DURING ASYMMETRIC DIVISION AND REDISTRIBUTION-like [Nicotiana sylvestris]XP_016483909.1 PREDICTED: protein POLAR LOCALIZATION DURING ASYMMETRIC DIVISION AND REDISTRIBUTION-like [Nicotiana tabacum]
MGSDDYCSISIITARACTEIRKRRSAETTCTRSFSTCISPRWILSRWFETKKVKEQQLQYVSRKKEKKINRKKKDYLTRLERESSSPSTALEGGDKKADSLNLGIGFGLIYLFNATKNELNKIVEIRREMEILLHNSKVEFQNQGRIRRNLSDSRAKISHHDSDYVEQFAYSTDIEEESEITCSHDHTAFNCKSMKGNERNLEMNQLEAELEVELERLQFHSDSEVMLKYPTQQNAEIMDSSEGSISTSFTEVYNPNACVTIESCGVPAEELNRKLHELLQTRQEERIKELESALESAMQKLEEKEKEICWWRDTAKVISQQVPSRRSLATID